MARHRNVRGYNYDEDFEDEDMFGQSVEDDYCISPATAAQFIYSKRDRHSSFTEPLEEEEEEEEHNDEELEKQKASNVALSSVDQARLFSCLEHMREVLGETVSEQVMIDAALKCQFDVSKALELVFKQDSNTNASTKPVSEDLLSTGKPAKEAIYSSKYNLSNDQVVCCPAPHSSQYTDKSNYFATVEKPLEDILDQTDNGKESLNSDFSSCLSLADLINESSCSNHSSSKPAFAEKSLSELLSNPKMAEGSGLSATKALEIAKRSKHTAEIPHLKELQLDQLKSRSVKGSDYIGFENHEYLGALNSFQASSFPKHSAPENHVLNEQINLFGSLSSFLHSEDSMSSDGENLSVPKFGSPSLADLIMEHKDSNVLQDLCIETPQRNPDVELQADSMVACSQLSELCATLSDVPSLTASLSSLAVTQPTAVKDPQISLSDLISEVDKPVFDDLNTLFMPSPETDSNIDLRSLISKPVDAYPPSLNMQSATSVPLESKHSSYRNSYPPKYSKILKKRTHCVKTLKARPSAFALSLCYRYIPKPCGNTVLMLHQDHEHNSSAVIDNLGHPALIPFDFQTPSPDDIVKKSQKKAFAR